MTSLRFSLLAAVVLAGFLPTAFAVAQAPVEWYGGTGGGGTLAHPTGQSRSGGAAAPLAPGVVREQPAAVAPTPPIGVPAHAALEPARVQPSPVAGRPSARPAADAAQAAPTVTGGAEQASPSAGPIAALPLTGLQLAAIAAAGLCLLIAGAVLRPRRQATERR